MHGTRSPGKGPLRDKGRTPRAVEAWSNPRPAIESLLETTRVVEATCPIPHDLSGVSMGRDIKV